MATTRRSSRLAIYGGAYLAEVFRAGILSVSRSFVEAGRSLGLSGVQIVRYVTLPIMFRTVLPSLSNTFISLFKDTSLAMAIAVPELTFVTRKVVTDTFQYIQAWTTAAVLYLVTTYAHRRSAPLPRAADSLDGVREAGQ